MFVPTQIIYWFIVGFSFSFSEAPKTLTELSNKSIKHA
jgi:hypothetical protein